MVAPSFQSMRASISRQPAWVATAGALACILLAAEIVCRIALWGTGLADRPVDIQTAGTLCAKVERVANYSGPKIVVLGDSLAYGAAMGDNGDADWRANDLASQVRAAYVRAQRPGDKPPLVMNLGLNGGLPADQLRILRLFEGRPLDVVIATTSIRSFASDFATADTAYSRAWLGNLSKDALPGCRLRSPADARGDATFGRVLGRVSVLYRSRGLIQANLFGGAPRVLLEKVRTDLKAKPATSTKPGVSAGGVPDLMATLGAGLGMDLQVLMLAKTRFQKITFAEPHAQVAATRALMAEAGKTAKTAVFVYGTESPRLLPQLLSSTRYQEARTSLHTLFGNRPANIVLLDAIRPAAKDYLDYVHVNRAGYALMAGEIVKALPSPAQR
jgi:hypothetical protein